MKQHTLFDLRSLTEYQLGHIPGAVNIPILNDDERAEVGTLYKREGKTLAVQRGLELFAEKADVFLQAIEQMSHHDRTVGLYCWRGGMRSYSVALWLAAMGYSPILLIGGYKQYRSFVLQELENFAKHPLLVLTGRTGSGKSAFLRSLPEGFPYVDFEALACHRGSAFGDLAQEESSPTQQHFENLLVDRYLDTSWSPKILVEIENFIGPVALPLNLRNAVVASPMILVSRDFEDRIKKLSEEYLKGWDDATQTLFEGRMKLLTKHLSKEQYQRIVACVAHKDFKTAISDLLILHYDRLYDKSIKRYASNIIAEFNLTHQTDEALSFMSKYLTM